MAQYLVKVLMAIDAKDVRSADRKVYDLLQRQIRRYDKTSDLLEWVFDTPTGADHAAIKPLKPIRSLVASSSTALDSLEDAYDRARAAHMMETNND